MNNKKESSLLDYIRGRSLFIWEAISSPHTSIREVGERRQARLLAALSLILLILFSIGTISAWSVNKTFTSGVYSLFASSILTTFVYILSRSKKFVLGAEILIISFIIAAFVNILGGSENPAGSLYSFVLISYVLASVFLPIWGLVSIVATSILGMGLLNQYVIPSDNIEIITAIGLISTIGVLQIILTIFRNSIEKERLIQLSHTNRELQNLQNTLEMRVIERTKEIKSAAEVGRILLQEHELDVLLLDAVNLIRDRFNLYYAQIYLVDSSNRYLILRSGSGEVGEELLRRAHRLMIDLYSINGRAALENSPVIVRDTLENKFFKPNPLLPLTRSEMAVPLQISGRILGVLDLQSEIPDYLTEEKVPVFETLAGQLAIALENASLYQERQHAQKDLKIQAQLLSRQGWHEYLNAVDRPEKIGFAFSEGELLPFENFSQPFDPSQTITVPIVVGGHPVGSIQLQKDSQKSWDISDTESVQAIATQIARRIENLRLLAHVEYYRAESEEANRKLIRGAWQEISTSSSKAIGFIYDQNQVVPINDVDNLPEFSFSRPISILGEEIGEIAFLSSDEVNGNAREIIDAVTERLSFHLQNLRLSDQTAQALSETDALLGITADLNASQNYQDVLAAITNRTILKDANQSLMMCLFDQPLGKEKYPEWIIPVAYRADLPVEIASRYPMSAFEKDPNTLFTKETVIIKDVNTDKRLDRITRKLFKDVFRANSSMIIPLVLADQSLGFVIGNYGEIMNFSESDIVRIGAIAGQVAITIQGLQLLNQTQERARREQLLREVTQRINTATSTDMVLYLAAQELGKVLKKQVFAYLKEKS